MGFAVNDAEIARLEHERIHWQQEAQRLNVIVHAQRERIHALEGNPDRLLLQKIKTFLSSLDARLIGAQDRYDAYQLAEKLGVMLDV
jgi:hypothetical protein